MNLGRVRRLLLRGGVALRFSDHAVIEARKDGLVEEDLEQAVLGGEVIEDYGDRALLLSFTREDGLPCHIVLEYFPRSGVVTVITAYIPDAKEWQPHWKKRRRKRRR